MWRTGFTQKWDVVHRTDRTHVGTKVELKHKLEQQFELGGADTRKWLSLMQTVMANAGEFEDG
jgi:hypothetical protein